MVAIVLGGTIPHIELIKKLKERSYYVILVDYLPSSPARDYSHEHIQMSTLDKEAVLSLAKEKCASLVISVAADQANVTACYVSEKLLLPHPYSFETSLKVTNKAVMKSIMVENGIPTSKYILIQKEDSIVTNGLQLPVIVKPVDSNSSKGITRVDDWDLLEQAIKKARIASRSEMVIVEEFVDGIEIGVDFIVYNGRIAITSSRERLKVNETVSCEQQIIGSIWPSDTANYLNEVCLDIAAKIASTFELNKTPFFMQAIVSDQGLYVLEFAPRIGGGDNFRLVKNLNGYDLIEAGINSFLGEPISFCINDSDYYFHDCYLYAQQGSISCIKALDSLADERVIEYYTVYKENGSAIQKELSSNNRIGTFTVKAHSREGLKLKRMKALERIRILDINGIDILYRDLYHDIRES